MAMELEVSTLKMVMVVTDLGKEIFYQFKGKRASCICLL